jgi:hypothetical protein
VALKDTAPTEPEAAAATADVPVLDALGTVVEAAGSAEGAEGVLMIGAAAVEGLGSATAGVFECVNRFDKAEVARCIPLSRTGLLGVTGAAAGTRTAATGVSLGAGVAGAGGAISTGLEGISLAGVSRTDISGEAMLRG